MSNKLEAALGGEPANTFTDEDGATYTTTSSNGIITLENHGDEILFFKSDATKIIALIAEAAK